MDTSLANIDKMSVQQMYTQLFIARKEAHNLEVKANELAQSIIAPKPTKKIDEGFSTSA